MRSKVKIIGDATREKENQSRLVPRGPRKGEVSLIVEESDEGGQVASRGGGLL